MGALISRWRAKPSTVEVLEKIDKDIKRLEEFREKNQRLQKLWVGRLLLYSSLLYLITCLIVYLWCLPDEWTARLTMTLPFFAFPLIIWCIRTLLIFFFSKRTERNNDALEDLKSQKKKILEEVMEKETYKTAKLILERFDPGSSAKETELPSAGTSATPRPGQEIRQRTAAQRNASTPPATPKQGSPKSPLAASPNLQRETPAPSGLPERAAGPSLQSSVLPRRPASPATSVPGMGLHPPGPPLARPVLPRERGVVDRVIEYLVGDGPQNRYALICQQCFSHNGMALKEEFEYIAFRCAYCFFLNPARKTRPQAPRLPDFSFEKKRCTELGSEAEPLEPRDRKPQETQETKESEDDVVQLVETNGTDDKAPNSEHLNDELAEEVEKEAENISATEEAISESTSAERSEGSLIKAE
ncbi:endoplasmic reticulum junction formation protein lunapark isoform X2 [Prinia subflava]|uniref:endoplasmic reticulum junction formation protein lunapark isoform X2 n=1 Tax=Prinia subflava TaxID=208062 RepID=UPI002FE20F08